MTAYQNQELFCHCPRCGASGLQQHTKKRFACKHCQFKFFLNAAAAVAALITDQEGKLLVAVRAKEPAKGMWDLPGGFVDPDESAEDALRREISEELNLRLFSLRYFCSEPNTYEYNGVVYDTLDLAYICRAENLDDIRPMDDVKDVFFKFLHEIDLANFGLTSIRKIVGRYLTERDETPG